MTHIHPVGADLRVCPPIGEFGSLPEFDGGCPLLQFVLWADFWHILSAAKDRPQIQGKSEPTPTSTRLLNPPILPTEVPNPILTLFNSIFKCYVGSLGVLRSLAKRITDSPNKNAPPKYTASAEFPKTLQCSHKLPNSLNQSVIGDNP